MTGQAITMRLQRAERHARARQPACRSREQLVREIEAVYRRAIQRSGSHDNLAARIRHDTPDGPRRAAQLDALVAAGEITA